MKEIIDDVKKKLDDKRKVKIEQFVETKLLELRGIEEQLKTLELSKKKVEGSLAEIEKENYDEVDFSELPLGYNSWGISTTASYPYPNQGTIHFKTKLF